MLALIGEEFSGRDLQLDRIYANANAFGDLFYPHTDGDSGREGITALYFANLRGEFLGVENTPDGAHVAVRPAGGAGRSVYQARQPGDRSRLLPPIGNFAARLQPQERAAIGDFLAAAVIGGPDTVRAGLAHLHKATGADELMLVSDVFDPALRLRSLDIAAQAHAAMAEGSEAVNA